MDTEYEPLLMGVDKPSNSHNISCRNLLTIICILIAGSIISYELITSQPQQPSITPIKQQSMESSRELITNNPNDDYLCEADFLYEEMNRYPRKYQYTCSTISSFG